MIEKILDVNKINSELESLVNEIASYHKPGDIINLSYSSGDVIITIK